METEKRRGPYEPRPPYERLLVAGDVRGGQGRNFLQDSRNFLVPEDQERLALPAADATHPRGALLALGAGLLVERVGGADDGSLGLSSHDI